GDRRRAAGSTPLPHRRGGGAPRHRRAAPARTGRPPPGPARRSARRVARGPSWHRRAALRPRLRPDRLENGFELSKRLAGGCWRAFVIRAVLFDLDETLIPEDEPLALAYRAVVPGDVDEFRAGLRATWKRDAPCPEYRARTQVSASDGLIAEFSGDGEELAALRPYLPPFPA